LRVKKTDGINPTLEALKLETQEELMLHFRSKDQRRPMLQQKAVRQEEVPLTQPFCFDQVFS
jgi:hypothetical protein